MPLHSLRFLSLSFSRPMKFAVDVGDTVVHTSARSTDTFAYLARRVEKKFNVDHLVRFSPSLPKLCVCICVCMRGAAMRMCVLIGG